MLSATNIRLYPTVTQQRQLAVQFGCVRWVWNEALAEMQRVYKETGKGLTYFDLCNRLPILKQKYIWLNDSVAQSLQSSLRNLARAFTNFFQKRSGYPRFKSKHLFKSVQYPQRVSIKTGQIKLPKLGAVKAVLHRSIIGQIKTVTVTQLACGHYYASILTDDGLPEPTVQFTQQTQVLGVDVGLIDLAVTSKSQHVANPRHLRKAQRNLKRKQQKLSRKHKGSKSRNKARQLVARAHERVKNTRKDFLDKLSCQLVRENQAIAVEDLCVKAMVRSPTLAKSISDAGWGMFARMLEYKCARAGKPFVRTGRFFPSTRTCSSCGTVHSSMALSERTWTCTCGAQHNRDVNAAKNIAAEGWRQLMASGTGASANGGLVSHV